jgi:hypothetical protein
MPGSRRVAPKVVAQRFNANAHRVDAATLGTKGIEAIGPATGTDPMAGCKVDYPFFSLITA